MSLIIGVVSQKGGVGKSTIARTIATEYARANWDVKLADLDASQGTSFNWQSRRLQNGLKPTVSVEMFKTANQALKTADNYDLMVLDGAPHSTQGTLDIAKSSDLLILPTGTALDDLEPTVRLAVELAKNGISKNKIVFLLNRVGNSQAELREAEEYLEATPFKLIKGHISEKTAYRRSSDMGQSLTETAYDSTNQKSKLVIKKIIEQINEALNKKEAA